LLLGGGTAFAQAPPKSPPKAQQAPKKAPAKGEEIAPVAEEAPEVKAGRGIVVLQRAGQPIGLGVVLGGDGRILTALSPLGSGNDVEAKFADDSVHKVKLGHHDRIWDLALLVPQTGKWTEGLAASSGDPLKEDATIRAFSSFGKTKPAPTPVDLRGRRTLIGADDQSLTNALELGSKVNAKDLGSPLIDERGRVVGILGRACLPLEGKPCAPVAFGIPVQAIKGFLKTVPADAVPPSAWLGIQGASETTPVAKGVRVVSVAKGSPAADAKLKAGEKGIGDVIVAVGGQPVTTPEELSAAIKKRAVGEKVALTVLSKGQYRSADVVLRAPPDKAAAAAPKAALVDVPKKEPPKAPPPPKKAPKPEKNKPSKKTKALGDEAEGPPRESDPFSEPL
jgi:serine protease Do